MRNKKYIGKIYGNFKVISALEDSYVKVRCQCMNCGNQLDILVKRLNNNNLPLCKCDKNPIRFNPIDNLIGKKFGKLTVLDFAGKDKQGQIQYLCKCDCGNLKIVRGYELRRGRIKTCSRKCTQEYIGTLRKRVEPFKHYFHILYRHFLLKDLLCKEWIENKNDMYEFVKDIGFNDNLSITRINENEKLSPTNIKLIKKKSYNKSICTKYGTLNLSELSKASGISVNTLRKRYYQGYRDEDLLKSHILTKQKIDTPYGPLTFQELSQKSGICIATLKSRYYKGFKGENLINNCKPRRKRNKLFKRGELKELSQKLNIKPSILCYRYLKYGDYFTNNKIIRRIINIDGIDYNLHQLSKKYNIPYPTLLLRYKNGIRGKDILKSRKNGAKNEKKSIIS